MASNWALSLKSLKCMNVPHGHLSSLLHSFGSLGDSCCSRVMQASGYLPIGQFSTQASVHDFGSWCTLVSLCNISCNWCKVCMWWCFFLAKITLHLHRVGTMTWAWPSWSTLGAGKIKGMRVHGRGHQTEQNWIGPPPIVWLLPLWILIFSRFGCYHKQPLYPVCIDLTSWRAPTATG
jgi:hypothetical protein